MMKVLSERAGPVSVLLAFANCMWCVSWVFTVKLGLVHVLIPVIATLEWHVLVGQIVNVTDQTKAEISSTVGGTSWHLVYIFIDHLQLLYMTSLYKTEKPCSSQRHSCLTCLTLCAFSTYDTVIVCLKQLSVQWLAELVAWWLGVNSANRISSRSWHQLSSPFSKRTLLGLFSGIRVIVSLWNTLSSSAGVEAWRCCWWCEDTRSIGEDCSATHPASSSSSSGSWSTSSSNDESRLSWSETSRIAV